MLGMDGAGTLGYRSFLGCCNTCTRRSTAELPSICGTCMVPLRACAAAGVRASMAHPVASRVSARRRQSPILASHRSQRAHGGSGVGTRASAGREGRGVPTGRRPLASRPEAKRVSVLMQAKPGGIKRWCVPAFAFWPEAVLRVPVLARGRVPCSVFRVPAGQAESD